MADVKITKDPKSNTIKLSPILDKGERFVSWYVLEVDEEGKSIKTFSRFSRNVSFPDGVPYFIRMSFSVGGDRKFIDKNYTPEPKPKPEPESMPDEPKKIISNPILNFAMAETVIQTEKNKFAPISERYEVTSPIVNGFRSQSVRQLTPTQATSLSNRGYTVKRVDAFTALSSNRYIRAEQPKTPLYQRYERSGISNVRGTRFQRRKIGAVIPKSQFQPRRIFKEEFREVVTPGNVTPHTSGLRLYYVVGRQQNIRITKATADALAKRNGWRLILLPVNNPLGSTKRGSTSINQTLLKPIEESMSKNALESLQGQQYQKNQERQEELQKIREENNKKLLEEANRVNQLIANLTAEITRIGSNTNDGQELSKYLEQLKKESDEKFKKANLESTAQINALTAQIDTLVQAVKTNAENIVKDVGKGVDEAGKGIFDFLKSPNTMMIAVLAVIVIVMMKK